MEEANSPQTDAASRKFADYPDQVGLLDSLAHNPPQSLLLEGGGPEGRSSLALYWAMTANCDSIRAASSTSPCLECPTCRQIMAKEYPDTLLYDGRIGNRQDEENPGIIRALNMANMRQLKSILGSRPRSAAKRVVIIDGMSAVREEALNSLLKVLEEPSPDTLFVLLAPMRDQILPTLVSRSLCVTLPWQSGEEREVPAFAEELGVFLQTGRGFLNSIAAKGALDANLAQNVLLACQNALVKALESCSPRNSLDRFFSILSKNPAFVSQIRQWLAEAQEMLALGASPARCLEGFASRVHVLGKRTQAL